MFRYYLIEISILQKKTAQEQRIHPLPSVFISREIMFLPIKSRLSFIGTNKRVNSSKGIQKSRGAERAHLPLQMRRIKHIPVCTNILTLISPVAIAPQNSSISLRGVPITHVNINGIRNSVTLNSKTDWCQQPLEFFIFNLLLGVLFLHLI